MPVYESIDELSARQRSHFETALDFASDISNFSQFECPRYRLGAVLTHKSKIICKGCNSQREYLHRQVITSLHAEMCLIHHLIKQRCLQNVKSKLEIWLIRIHRHNDITPQNSTPCSCCLESIKQLRLIKRIWFITADGKIAGLKPNQLSANYTHANKTYQIRPVRFPVKR